MNPDSVFIALAGDTVWVRITEKGTFQNSHPIKKWVIEKIEAGCNHIFIELSECTSMDSTFMGIITGLSIRMKGLSREPVILTNVSPHNIRLLETLGLNKYLVLKERFDIDSSLIWEPLPIEPLDKMAITRHMLDAHEQLLGTGGVASEQFKNVHKLLKEDLEHQTKKNQHG